MSDTVKRFAIVLLVAALGIAAAWCWTRRTAQDGLSATPNAWREPAPGGTSLDTPVLGGARETAPLANAASLADSANGPALVQPLARVFGTISYAATDAPAAAYELCAFGEGLRGARTTTGAAGEFEFLLSPGARFVGAAPREGLAWCERLDLAPGEERRLDHAIGELEDLCVRVWSLSDAGVLPLAAARIAVVQADPDRFGAVDAAAELSAPSVWTDVRGEATASTSGLVAYVVYVSAAGYLPSIVDLDFDPYLSSGTPTMYDGCLNVVLEPEGAELCGRVVDHGGSPVPGAIVFGAPHVARGSEVLKLGEREAPAVLSRRPPFARTDAAGSFRVRLPVDDELDVVVLPRRADLVHHFVRALDPAELQAPVEIRLPQAWVLELELVDENGAALEGLASVRDPDGRAHAPLRMVDDVEFARSSAGRVFPLDQGRLKLMHAGGVARVGLSPRGVWREGEVELRIPAGSRDHALRVKIP